MSAPVGVVLVHEDHVLDDCLRVSKQECVTLGAACCDAKGSCGGGGGGEGSGKLPAGTPRLGYAQEPRYGDVGVCAGLAKRARLRETKGRAGSTLARDLRGAQYRAGHSLQPQLLSDRGPAVCGHDEKMRRGKLHSRFSSGRDAIATTRGSRASPETGSTYFTTLSSDLNSDFFLSFCVSCRVRTTCTVGPLTSFHWRRMRALTSVS